MPGARWMVFDTNVYVAALREGLDGASLGRLEEAARRTFLASVVSAELRAGALDDAGRRVVIELVRRFEPIVERRRRYPREDRATRAGLPDEGPRALSARQIGATLVTENLRDFGLLRRYVRFELEAAPGAR